jgi:hypothetical protein
MNELLGLIEDLNRAGWSVFFDAAHSVRVRRGIGASAEEYSRRVPPKSSPVDALKYLKARTESAA